MWAGHAGVRVQRSWEPHLHERLHRQAGRLDPQQPVHTGGHRAGTGHTAGMTRSELKLPTAAESSPPCFLCLQLVGMLLSQILINQIKDQVELLNYNLKHQSDPWS